MERRELIKKAYDRSAELTMTNSFYESRVHAFTVAMVEEDVRDRGDITTDSVLSELMPETKARLVAKASGICAGIEEVCWFFRRCGLKIGMVKQDGSRVEEEETMMEFSGSYRDLLKSERMGLNLVQRMSGIATLTNELVSKTGENGPRIAATRKTPWGSLDNKAVAVGGGLTHRLGLWDSILIKDNHLVVLQQNGFEENYIEESLARAWQHQNSRTVEIEVENREEALRAAVTFETLGADSPGKIPIILLDNFTPEALRSMIPEIHSVSSRPILLEASGNIGPDNVAQYLETGVDIISMGWLTHSPKAFDISQRHDLSYV